MSKEVHHSLSDQDIQLQQRIFILSAVLLLIGLFLNIGVQPIFLEEPRRSFIAFEMLINNNLWVPMELGEHYYKKPPLFNWLLMLSTGLFGGFDEFALRLPTVLSTIGIGLLIYWLGKKYVSEEFGQINSFLFIIAGGILFYFSTLAEIDLFYSLITFASFVCLFHFYQTKQFYLLFISCYLLGAVGALTKGPPSFLFLAFSIGGYFLYKRDFKRLFTMPHFLGIFLFLGIVGGYLYIYQQYHPLESLLAGMWGQSSEMTVLEQDRFKLVKHIFQFPLDILKDTLPSSLLLFFAIRKGLWKVIKQNELVLFGLILLVVNLPVYWVSPGTRQRYIYMLYPFLFMIFSYCYLQTRDIKDWRSKTFRIIIGVLIAVMAIGCIAINFIPDLAFIQFRWLISIFGFAALATTFYIFLKKPKLSLATLILAAVIARIVFDLTVLPQRAHDSSAQRDKDLAGELAQIVGEDEVYIYKEGRISFTCVYYLDILRQKPLVRNYEQNPEAYYLAPPDWIDAPHDVVYEFDYKGTLIQLFRFKSKE